MTITPTTAYHVEYEYIKDRPMGPLDKLTIIWCKTHDTCNTHEEAVKKLNRLIQEYSKRRNHLRHHFHYYTGRFRIVRVDTRVEYTHLNEIDTNVETAS